MTEIINILIWMSTKSILDNPVVTINVPCQGSRSPFIDLGDDLIYSHQALFSDYKYMYKYRYSDSLYIQTKEMITNDNRATVAYDPADITRIRTAHYDCQVRKYVKQDLALMIIQFLGKLQPDNTLDFEFTSRFFQNNESIQNLAEQKYFPVITALLKCVSPEVAIQQLQSEISSLNKKTVLHEILDRCPSDQSAVVAAKQAVDCMRALKNKNQRAFEIFIDTPKGFDLLKELKRINIALANECFNIHPEFMKSRFTASSEGLDMACGSSSAVGAGNTVTSHYSPPAATGKQTTGSSMTCSVM